MKFTIEPKFEVGDIVQFYGHNIVDVEVIGIVLDEYRDFLYLCEFLNGERKLISESDLKKKESKS